VAEKEIGLQATLKIRPKTYTIDKVRTSLLDSLH
jgi:hypothetical protein